MQLQQQPRKMKITILKISTSLFLVFLLFVPALAAEDILIADFEGTDFGGWTVTGEAFGKGPVNGKIERQGRFGDFKGKGLPTPSTAVTERPAR